MNVRVHFLNGGYCRQLLATIDGRSFRMVRFHAVFLAIAHPRLGWIVCDTGYGAQFFDASRRWPRCLYRVATPVTLRGSAAAELATIGVRANEVRHVVLTHFHADHVGGLREFPNAKIYYHEEALAPLLARSPWRQTFAAFLPALLPEDLTARSAIIAASAFSAERELPFRTHDLFGDGMLQLLEMPGHAPGHVGLVFTDAAGGVKTLYCADAYWRSEQLSTSAKLPLPSRALQWDSRAYHETIEKLRLLARAGTHRLLACHAEETQRHVANGSTA